MKVVLLRHIQQKDNHTFTVEWSDGKTRDYRLSDVQRHCPCAKCCSEKVLTVEEGVRANRIVSVGRYAMRIEFTSGCSAGIYDYEMLRKL